MTTPTPDDSPRLDALTRRVEIRAQELCGTGIPYDEAWIQAVMEEYAAVADAAPAPSVNAEIISEMARRAYAIRMANHIPIESAWELAAAQMRKEGQIGN